MTLQMEEVGPCGGSFRSRHDTAPGPGRKFPRWPRALLLELCHVGLEEHPGSKEAHCPGPFLPTGPLSSSRGQPSSSTLVAVPVFLVLTSLTYLVFKLSPRWVGKVCVRVCVCVAVCVWGHLGPERPSLPPSALPAI